MKLVSREAPLTHHESKLQTLPLSRFLKDKLKVSRTSGWGCIFKVADAVSGADLSVCPAAWVKGHSSKLYEAYVAIPFLFFFNDLTISQYIVPTC